MNPMNSTIEIGSIESICIIVFNQNITKNRIELQETIQIELLWAPIVLIHLWVIWLDSI